MITIHADSRTLPITIYDRARGQGTAIVYIAHAPDHDMWSRARAWNQISEDGCAPLPVLCTLMITNSVWCARVLSYMVTTLSRAIHYWWSWACAPVHDRWPIINTMKGSGVVSSREYLWSYWTYKNRSPIKICRILPGEQSNCFQNDRANSLCAIE